MKKPQIIRPEGNEHPAAPQNVTLTTDELVGGLGKEALYHLTLLAQAAASARDGMATAIALHDSKKDGPALQIAPESALHIADMSGRVGTAGQERAQLDGRIGQMTHMVLASVSAVREQLALCDDKITSYAEKKRKR